MSNPTAKSTQNGTPMYPPGLPTTPGSPIVYVPATQTPPMQADTTGQTRNDDLPVDNDLTPMVINDTFDGADSTPYPAFSTPPLTQHPRSSGLPLGMATVFNAASGLLNAGDEQVPQGHVYPSAAVSSSLRILTRMT